MGVVSWQPGEGGRGRGGEGVRRRAGDMMHGTRGVLGREVGGINTQAVTKGWGQ